MSLPPSTVEVKLVHMGSMQALNSKYRGINQPTDILSFSESDWEGDHHVSEMRVFFNQSHACIL